MSQVLFSNYRDIARITRPLRK